VNSGYYAAFTGLVARLEALDVIASNLANVNTSGFRAQREFYNAVTANLTNVPLTPLNRAINDFGVLGGSTLDLRQGSLQSTGNPLDLAISGSAFFAIQTPRGVRYMRNGSFHINATGQLLDSQENAVLGLNGALNLPPGDVAIGEDGSLSVAGAVAGKLRLADFVPGTNLQQEGSSYLVAPPSAEQPAAASKVEQGMLESANLNPVTLTVTMMDLQRHAELLERTLSIFQNDLNRTAIEDLARVS
jgi:flagellar basal-body rod protein FlgF/flagellar basal-body rod protein FlgG